MKLRRIFIVTMVVLLAVTAWISYKTIPDKQEKLDVVAVNDITKKIAGQWEELGEKGLPETSYGIDYVVVDKDGTFLAATRSGLNETLTAAAANRDTMVDITRNEEVIGKLIIYNATEENWKVYHTQLIRILLAFIGAVGIFLFLFLTRVNRDILVPFQKMEAFARHVAAGNLDAPLFMDEHNLFGAFTESFDLMREELARARENERVANESKKELVASLSHDVKTPVASIQAVAELMSVKTDDEKERHQLSVIRAKAEQINALVTNMFDATLEELQQLRVEVSMQSSAVLPELAQRADYDKMLRMDELSECMIQADLVRLEQVIDNIIGNSYKYAGTAIDLTSQICGEYLEVIFQDYGPGISEEQAPLVFQKFYRGEGTGNVAGSGLGLYISRYLMQEMGGALEVLPSEDGFRIKMRIMLAR